MKQKFLKFALSSVALFSVASVGAQDRTIGPEWGTNDSIREHNYYLYSFFQDAFRMKAYEEAAGYLQELMANVPAARHQIYHAGLNIYRTRYNTVTDESQKKIFLDSLMLIYDKWIENFKNHPQQGEVYLRRAKVIDYAELMPDDRQGIKKLYNEAIAADSTVQYPDVVFSYFQFLTDDYTLYQTMEASDYLSEYETLAEILDSSSHADKAKYRDNLDQLAVSSGALDCGSLETIFAPQLEANPDDLDLHRKLLALLRRNKCDSPFLKKVTEDIYRLDPTSQSSLELAASFTAKKEYAQAIEILQKALTEKDDPEYKETIYIRIAINYLDAKNSRAAADNARQAIAINPTSGMGYFALAQAYVIGSTACEEGFERQSVYWLVYDNLAIARRYLEKEGDARLLKTIDAEMATYRNNFPLREETFLRELAEGSAYAVKCGWITGNTTVRTVK